MSSTTIAALFSGLVIGFILGLLGGGGSILGTPMMLYVVGIADTHLAIGTAAMAVAVNSFVNLVNHARTSQIWWRSATVFAGVGACGVFAGSKLAKIVNGQLLLFLFGILMVVVGLLMLPRTRKADPAEPVAEKAPTPKLAIVALAVGFAAGFFGVGGGFLIVPGLVWAAEMPLPVAIGSALLSVSVFATGTLISYGSAGLVDWQIGAEVIAGGVVGGLFGVALARKLAPRKRLLSKLFAFTIMLCAVYVLYRSALVYL